MATLKIKVGSFPVNAESGSFDFPLTLIKIIKVTTAVVESQPSI